MLSVVDSGENYSWKTNVGDISSNNCKQTLQDGRREKLVRSEHTVETENREINRKTAIAEDESMCFGVRRKKRLRKL